MRRRAFIAAGGATSVLALGASAQRSGGPEATPLPSPTLIVATVAALKALVNRPSAVVTQGWAEPNDGGGGPAWTWVADSTLAADDFLVVRPAAGPPGRYVRLIQSGATVSPKWGGAGLGAADDTARFQAVVAAAGAYAVDLSGCTIAITRARIESRHGCSGLFSDGSGRITCAPGTTPGTFLVTVHKSDFYVDRIFFEGPISKTAGAPPACATLLSFEGDGGGPTDRQRVTNCRFRGGANGCQFRNPASNGFGYFTDNVVTDTWGDATIVRVPRNFIFARNLVANCGYDPAKTDSACHFATTFSTTPADNLIVTENVIRDCCVGFEQEAIDLNGNLIRNAVFANNVLDRVTYGGFEFKSATTEKAHTDFYGDVLIQGNIVNFAIGGRGIGVALNNRGAEDGKFRRFKIAANQFLCDGPGSRARGINVACYDNVDITGNQFTHIESAVLVHAGGSPSRTAHNVVIQGNSIDVSGDALQCTHYSVARLAVQGNHVVAGGFALRCTAASVSNLVCTGNHLETTADNGRPVELSNIRGGRVASNTVVGAGAGMTIGGDTSGLRVTHNDVTAAAGDAFVVVAGLGVVISDNTCAIAAASRIVSGAGSYVSVNNSRGASADNPTGRLAGALGDIVWNSAPAPAGTRGWICTRPGDIGTARYDGLPIGG